MSTEHEPYVRVTLGDIYQVVLRTEGAVNVMTGRVDRHEVDIAELRRQNAELKSDALTRSGLRNSLLVAGFIVTAISALIGLLVARIV